MQFWFLHGNGRIQFNSSIQGHSLSAEIPVSFETGLILFTKKDIEETIAYIADSRIAGQKFENQF
jgi:hypothetical protein